MATKRSREGSGAERSDRGNDLWNKEADLGEQVQESATGPHDTTGMTLENFLEHSRLSLWLSMCNVCSCLCASVYKWSSRVCSWVCACGCVWACCVQRQTCPRGRKTLEIGYCITEAIYLFWGLTYLIPLLNPVGVNALAFPIIWLSVTQRESGLLLLPVTGFSMQVAEL